MSKKKELTPRERIQQIGRDEYAVHFSESALDLLVQATQDREELIPIVSHLGVAQMEWGDPIQTGNIEQMATSLEGLAHQLSIDFYYITNPHTFLALLTYAAGGKISRKQLEHSELYQQKNSLINGILDHEWPYYTVDESEVKLNPVVIELLAIEEKNPDKILAISPEFIKGAQLLAI